LKAIKQILLLDSFYWRKFLCSGI